jgi:hypothetical protein
MTLLDRVVATLEAAGVPHALIGAAAAAARGLARSTYDVDLLTTDARVLDDAFWHTVRACHAAVDVRRGDDEDPLRGVVRIELEGERPVDVIVGRHDWQARAVAAADRVTGGPPIVRAADLVLLKLYAGGSQDLWDVRELLRLPGGDDLAAEVDGALAGMPSFMHEHWKRAHQ